MSTRPVLSRRGGRGIGRRRTAALAAVAVLAAACGAGAPAGSSPAASPTTAASGSVSSSTAAAGSVAAGSTAGGSTAAGSAGGTATSSPAAGGTSGAATADWAAVLARAKGQTVNWYMYGGDETLNRFVTGYVAQQLAADGVTLQQVRITDTAQALDKVLGEKQAGRTSGGSVDAIWVNGENFATGVQAGLWSCGWPRQLPNARYVDFADPAVANDFGVPVDGCEAAWQRADSALVYDSAALTAADVASVSSLFAWAKAHPGRLTYPALPDFTGSMAVRTVLYDTVGGPSALAGAFDETRYTAAAQRLWPRLRELAPSLWKGGATYPQSQDQVEKLYADGEISAYFTYGPGAVGEQVRKGQFPDTTREAVLSVGNIGNVSFLAVPAAAAHHDAALVLANVLQDPRTQLELYKAEGAYPAIDLDRLDAPTRAQFAAVPVPESVLPLDRLTAHTQPELASGYVTRIEKDWKTEVLQR
ncbi:ABC transporter substrate-binding protein [Nakamurella endophytica]|uniref:ABC transporter substrate-binding protein n=1 Tax=Nakamurella endophytica TaxID=1748367 RepID=A0A917SM84_9ACTN|nr:ABC transporter substrate-binding protein [Nakamurella endophytica]GGL89068.1 ABC transporter substrate-binding protein [Nakamurella endophytica]